MRVGIFLDFISLATRAEGPHGAHVRGAKRNPHVLRAHNGHTCGEPNEIEMAIRALTDYYRSLLIRYVSTACLAIGECSGSFVNALSVLSFDPSLTLVEHVEQEAEEGRVLAAVDRLLHRAARVNEYYPLRVRMSSKDGGPGGDPSAKSFLVTAMSWFKHHDYGAAQARDEDIYGKRAIKVPQLLREHCIANALDPSSFATVEWASTFGSDYLQGLTLTAAEQRQQEVRATSSSTPPQSGSIEPNPISSDRLHVRLMGRMCR